MHSGCLWLLVCDLLVVTVCFGYCLRLVGLVVCLID